MAAHITRVIYCTGAFHMFTEPEIPDIIIPPWSTAMCEEDAV